jgi:hypothetical protein
MRLLLVPSQPEPWDWRVGPCSSRLGKQARELQIKVPQGCSVTVAFVTSWGIQRALHGRTRLRDSRYSSELVYGRSLFHQRAQQPAICGKRPLLSSPSKLWRVFHPPLLRTEHTASTALSVLPNNRFMWCGDSSHQIEGKQWMMKGAHYVDSASHQQQ